MTVNFTLVPQNPTPNDILKKLIQITPEFAIFWKNECNLFINEDETFTLHGLFIVFSRFTREHFLSFKETQRKNLFAFIEDCVKKDFHSDSGVSNAACTCFLENLAGEGKLSGEIIVYLSEESKKYFLKLHSTLT